MKNVRDILYDFLEKAVEHIEEILVAVVIISIIVLFSYGVYNSAIAPKEGIVISKRYSKGYYYTTYETIRRKGETISVPVQKYEEPSYTITIKGINKKGEEQEYSLQVSPEEYANIEIGDTYIREYED